MVKKIHYLQLIKIKVVGNLKAETAKDYLSFLWWVIEPIFQMFAYYFVFGILLSRGTDNFIPFLLCGLIPWLWFSKCINRSTMSIINGKSLMMQVYIPKIILPMIVVCQDAIKQMVIFVLLFIFLLIYGISPSYHWICFPLVAIIQLLVIFACSFIVAAIIPFMHDFRYLVATGLQLMFFLSGVFYSVNTIPAKFQKFIFLNPMATLLQNYRQVLLNQQWPNWSELLSISLISLIVIFIMWSFIRKYDHIYPRVIL